jgi:hypothetical protein
MNRSKLAMPAAILVGSGIIAWVLARGLDRIAEAEAKRPVEPVRSVAAASPQASLSSAGNAAPMPLAVDESRQRAEEQAEFAFVRQQPDYVRACWKPAPAPSGGPPDLGGAFEFDVTFDASGAETARVMKTGGYAKPELSECVRGVKLPPLKIPPPGRALTVTTNIPIP